MSTSHVPTPILSYKLHVGYILASVEGSPKWRVIDAKHSGHQEKSPPADRKAVVCASASCMECTKKGQMT
jgi:hypothetical protein